MSFFEENKKNRNYDDEDDISNSLSSSVSEGSNYSNSDHNLYVHEKKCKKVKNKIILSSRTYFKHTNI